MIILASASSTRRRLLKAAYIEFQAEPAFIDEDEIKRSLEAEQLSCRDIADCLAESKSTAVSRQYPGFLVLGADQILENDKMIVTKCSTEEMAFEQLKTLSGKSHKLHTAMVICKDGSPIWRHVTTSTLWMRELSDQFLSWYCSKAGETLTNSVGCYAIEGLGRHLFWKIDGDETAIQGLHMFPLMDFLRRHQEIPV